MTRQGKVVKIKDGKTYVAVDRETACSGNCANCLGCPDTTRVIEAKNPIGAGVGDDVVIGTDTSAVLTAAFFVYLLPLLLIFGVCILADAYLKNAALTTVLVLLAVVVWMAVIRLLNRRQFQSVILEVARLED